MTALAPELSALGRSLLALAAVIVLVLAARRLMPRPCTTRVEGEPLTLAASLALDTRNRVVVVRRGSTEFVLAVGAHGVTSLDPSKTLRTGADEAA